MNYSLQFAHLIVLTTMEKLHARESFTHTNKMGSERGSHQVQSDLGRAKGQIDGFSCFLSRTSLYASWKGLEPIILLSSKS